MKPFISMGFTATDHYERMFEWLVRVSMEFNFPQFKSFVLQQHFTNNNIA